MKLNLITLALLFFINLTYGQDAQCLEKMKIGKFKYEGKLDGTVIVRTKKKHIEYSNGGKSKLILKVEWKNDSTYVLTHKKSIKDPGCLEKGGQIKVEIISCEGNKYLARYTSDNCGNGESWFIKTN